MLDVRSLIWGFGERCSPTIVHCTISQPSNVYILNGALLKYSPTSNPVERQKGTGLQNLSTCSPYPLTAIDVTSYFRSAANRFWVFFRSTFLDSGSTDCGKVFERLIVFFFCFVSRQTFLLIEPENVAQADLLSSRHYING